MDSRIICCISVIGNSISSLKNDFIMFKGVSNPNLGELKGLIKNGKVSGNNIISHVDENTQIIFRDDTGVNVHPIKPNGYIDPVDHYNVEIQTKTPAGKWKSKWSYHIVLDDKGNIIDRFD